MNEKVLYKKEVPKFFKELSKGHEFFAPVNVKGNIEFKEIKDSKEIQLDFLNSKVPPKEVLFPKMETLFEYEIKDDSEIEIQKRKDLHQEKIIFGIRPCDAHSFMLLENFFEHGKYEDNIFLKKREHTTLIGLGCNLPKSTCFCTSLGGHPFKEEDMDVFLVDLGDKYLIRGISEKGKVLLDQLNWLMSAREEDQEKALDLSNEAELSIKTKLDLEDTSAILNENYEHPLWKSISENCLGCGSCSFLCPTCHCFDVIDENDHYNNRGRRIRIWDTCQFCLYTLEASGHNPRPNEIERCRNRIMHKFCYYPNNYDLIGCVGCGRCIQLCPVNNDLREIIRKINSIKEKPKVEEKLTVAKN